MTSSEQRRLIEELAWYERKMTRDECDLFSILVRRQKDDEDLDRESMDRLRALHGKYVVHKSRPAPGP